MPGWGSVSLSTATGGQRTVSIHRLRPGTRAAGGILDLALASHANLMLDLLSQIGPQINAGGECDRGPGSQQLGLEDFSGMIEPGPQPYCSDRRPSWAGSGNARGTYVFGVEGRGAEQRASKQQFYPRHGAAKSGTIIIRFRLRREPRGSDAGSGSERAA